MFDSSLYLFMSQLEKKSIPLLLEVSQKIIGHFIKMMRVCYIRVIFTEGFTLYDNIKLKDIYIALV